MASTDSLGVVSFRDRGLVVYLLVYAYAIYIIAWGVDFASSGFHHDSWAGARLHDNVTADVLTYLLITAN